MSNKKHIPAIISSISPLYKRMQNAIAECYSVDDCKQIATQANAIAAYYKQIKDDESVKKFLQVKIRAWRRIGEILIGAGIDKSECNTHSDGTFNTAEYIRRIRASFQGNKAIEELSDAAVRQALRIGELSSNFFDQNVGKFSSIDAIVNAFAAVQRREWEATPEGQAELKERTARAKEWEKKQQQEARQQTKQQQEEAQLRQVEAASIDALMVERNKAFAEVGITLERHDREHMHQIVFLLKKSIHEILRQAAFDNRTTMQSILRAGLMMWFIAHGYDVPADDMHLPQREDQNSQRRQRVR